MSVSSIIGGGIRLVRTQPRVAATWIALHFLVVAIGMVIFRPLLLPILDMQRQAMAVSATGVRTPPTFHPEIFGMVFLIEILMLVFMTIFFAAVVRAVHRPTGDRFAYLRIGMDELRLFGLGIVFVIAGFVAEIVALIALFLAGFIASLIIGKIGGTIVGGVFGILYILAVIYVSVRLSLSGALTVLDGRIVIKDAWRATKGKFWTLFGVFFILSLIYMVVMIFVVAVTNPQILIAYAHMDTQVLMAVAQAQVARQGDGYSLGLIPQMIVGAIFGVGTMIMSFGAIATAALEMGNSSVGESRSY